jgi:hypothetical protein
VVGIIVLVFLCDIIIRLRLSLIRRNGWWPRRLGALASGLAARKLESEPSFRRRFRVIVRYVKQ